MNNQSIQQVLQQAMDQVDRLDAQLILAMVLGEPKSFLLTWPDHTIDETSLNLFNHLVYKRAQGYPLAYITGQKEFWDMVLIVTPDVLIPRPDTELLVELALAKITPGMNLLELATGSGAIACALARERADIQITATDISPQALMIAQRNITQYHLSHIVLIESNWFEHVQNQKFDIIIANPPYLSDTDPYLTTDIRFEPRSALVSGPQGDEDYVTIISQAQRYLKPDGWLMLEHGSTQGSRVRELLTQYKYKDVFSEKDLAGHERVTAAKIG